MLIMKNGKSRITEGIQKESERSEKKELINISEYRKQSPWKKKKQNKEKPKRMCKLMKIESM